MMRFPRRDPRRLKPRSTVSLPTGPSGVDVWLSSVVPSWPGLTSTISADPSRPYTCELYSIVGGLPVAAMASATYAASLKVSPPRTQVPVAGAIAVQWLNGLPELQSPTWITGIDIVANVQWPTFQVAER